MQQSSKTEPSVGFLTVEHSESIGWTGGYLILNSGGRPLEFHCTLPVRPSRTHEILYGKTLRNYLICDLILPALLKQSKAKPTLLCSDLPELISYCVGKESELPVALVADGVLSVTVDVAGDFVQGHQGVPFWVAESQRSAVNHAFDSLSELPDWSEPLARIREAIREAQSGAAARAA